MTVDFKFPIHILCFNRPDALERLLASLSAQSVPVDGDRVFFWADGYAGSKDEFLGRPDRTTCLEAIISRYFPSASIFRSAANLGIAANFRRAEEFSIAADEDSVYFEEDLVLSPDYLRALLDLESAFAAYPQVVAVSAHGLDIVVNSDPRFRPFSHRPEPWPVGLTHRTWGHLVRRAHLRERHHLLDTYFRSLGSGPYWKRDVRRVRREMARLGLDIRGGAQDEVKAEIVRKLGKMHIVGLSRLAFLDGDQGEHFVSTDRLTRPDLFAAGFKPWSAPKDICPCLVEDLARVNQAVRPRDTLIFQTRREGWMHRAKNCPDAGDVLEIFRFFNAYPAEENADWGPFVWLKPLQLVRFPGRCQELVFSLPGKTRNRKGRLGGWIISEGKLTLCRKDALHVGRWAIFLLPGFIPAIKEPPSDDRRLLAFPVKDFRFV